MLTKRITILLSLLLIFSNSLLSQSPLNKDYIRAVQDADQFFYFSQDYESAAKLYGVLLEKYPGNSNLQAKLGISDLNVDGKKKEALDLLKKASANVVPNDKSYTEYGQAAPVDTWYYLAHAYHLNDSLDKAISVYTDARRKLTSDASFRIEYIDNQIKACQYAIEANKKKIKVGQVFFAPWLTDYNGAANPVISLNDSVFIFTQRKEDGNHIMCSYKKGIWEKPQDITRQLAWFDRLWSNSITADGTMLVLYLDNGVDGDLYYSHRS